MTSLYAQARALFTPELMTRLEDHFHEPPVPMERAVRAAVSSLVGEAIDRASTEDGATQMLSQLHTYHDASPVMDLRTAVNVGKPVAAGLLGDRLLTARDVVSSSSSVSAATATGVLALGAPLVLSMLGRLRSADATEFGTLLAGERTNTVDAGPASVTALLEDGGLSWRHILPMILMGVLLFALPFLYHSGSETPVAPQTTPAKILMPEPKPEALSLPGGGPLNGLPGTMNYALTKFLAGTEPAPRRFTFDHLNFESNQTAITADSRATLADLATILKAYPAVDIRLEGDNPADGDRAAALKTMLQTDGIAPTRISTAGKETPNSRGLELVVLKK